MRKVVYFPLVLFAFLSLAAVKPALAAQPADTQFEQGYGFGNAEDEYLVGDWDGDGRDNLAVRRGSTILMDYNFDGDHNFEQGYGDVGTFDENYLVGDWDGDGRDNIAVRRDSTILEPIRKMLNRTRYGHKRTEQKPANSPLSCTIEYECCAAWPTNREFVQPPNAVPDASGLRERVPVLAHHVVGDGRYVGDSWHL
jgi:hypothetical protein